MSKDPSRALLPAWAVDMLPPAPEYTGKHLAAPALHAPEAKREREGSERDSDAGANFVATRSSTFFIAVHVNYEFNALSTPCSELPRLQLQTGEQARILRVLQAVMVHMPHFRQK